MSMTVNGIGSTAGNGTSQYIDSYLIQITQVTYGQGDWIGLAIDWQSLSQPHGQYNVLFGQSANVTTGLSYVVYTDTYHLLETNALTVLPKGYDLGNSYRCLYEPYINCHLLNVSDYSKQVYQNAPGFSDNLTFSGSANIKLSTCPYDLDGRAV
jgi:hypothetical protein